MVATFLHIIFLAFNVTSTPTTTSLPDEIKREIVYKVNQVRAKGCKCGNTYYSAAGSVKWNETLYKSAMSHAKDMTQNNFFAHYSSSGLNIGERLDKFGYNWMHAGENLGEGQVSFDEVMYDWIKSPTHCQMLMNPNVKEVAVAKFGKYWVQHFGTRIPPGARRVD